MDISISTYLTDTKTSIKRLIIKVENIDSVHDVYVAKNPEGITYYIFVWRSGTAVMNWVPSDYKLAESFVQIGDTPIVMKSDGEYVNVPMSYRIK
ncbi:hypothetical protein [Lactiplantibacillus herbarum]|uniref:hypothetical protein n=1 Tax=Lactiplantibacillus herbarum TaxID=1670446 RepID=UPI00064F1D64|nr:hypothetical protein [Lactiplantibacillus herbarum]